MKIVDIFRKTEALELYDAGKMMDFLPKIGRRSRHDQGVLDTWQKHFETLKVPYLVLEVTIPNGHGQSRQVFQLWKQRRI